MNGGGDRGTFSISWKASLASGEFPCLSGCLGRSFRAGPARREGGVRGDIFQAAYLPFFPSYLWILDLNFVENVIAYLADIGRGGSPSLALPSRKTRSADQLSSKCSNSAQTESL